MYKINSVNIPYHLAHLRAILKSKALMNQLRTMGHETQKTDETSATSL